MSEKPIFYDARGRRQKRAVGVGATVLAVIAAVIGVVVISVFIALPFLPGIVGTTPIIFRNTHPPLISSRGDQLRQTGFLLEKAQKELQDQQLREQRAARNQKGRRVRVGLRPETNTTVPVGPPIVAAFYAPWEETGLTSLERNADKLTHLMPAWLHISPDGRSLDLVDYNLIANPYNKTVEDTCRAKGISLYPVLNNALNSADSKVDGLFETDHQASHLLASPAVQDELISKIVKWLVAERCQGLNVDFENLSDQDYEKLPAFLARLRPALHAQNLGLSADVEVSRLKLAQEIATNSDFLVLMDYDEHSEDSEAGPIASLDWFCKNVADALNYIPANKLVVGMANYGYDWPTSRKGEKADSITYQDAVMLAQESRDDLVLQERVQFDPNALNSHVSYESDDGHHEVWLVDGPSAYNEYKFVRSANLRGTALWALGSEDPTVWNFMAAGKAIPPASQALATVEFPYEINFEGPGGEILEMKPGFERSIPGFRRITQDPSTGYCSAAVYDKYPKPIAIDRQGSRKETAKYVALTFDDGPDPRWTPLVLDALHELKVPATFFLIGENAVEHPGLVRREYGEGHEIGNHSFYHPNLGEVSEFRCQLEIEATERAIQSIIGRSSLLFRPPYNADSEPTTAADVQPVWVASRLGYYTVGEAVDTQDWDLLVPTGKGKVRPKTADEIARVMVEEVENGKGNVVLMHDAGGDRHLTVEALKMAVPQLQAKGYKFVGVSSLIQIGRDKHAATRNDIMPPLGGGDLLLLPFEQIAVFGWYAVTTFLILAFLVAIGLGLGRIVVVTPLAVYANRKKPLLVPFAPGAEPFVSVIVAAFNEETVITGTIESVLSSDYAKLEVIVVDDGSTDGTFETINAAFKGHPRVQILRQENAGKAAALNHGMSFSKGEIYVYLDADTLLEADAISKLVAHFSDLKVGAVAGNVKVGNRLNLLTRLQALEYITSQNLDRRAYAHVNAITVVPGAIGAWRKTAVENAGGYTSDTLAEDMDLTWRVRLSGWKIHNETDAYAYTEAPATLKSFFKQRFRWTFGTLQCLFKHRKALGRNGSFGRVVLPALWLYQFALQVIAPFVDLQLLYSVGVFLTAYTTRSVLTKDSQPLPDAAQTMAYIGFMYAIFFVVELVSAFVAFQMERERKSLLWWLFLQRVVYRQVLYLVVWKAIWTAARGARTGWGKFERKGTVPSRGGSALPSRREEKEPVAATSET